MPGCQVSASFPSACNALWSTCLYASQRIAQRFQSNGLCRFETMHGIRPWSDYTSASFTHALYGTIYPGQPRKLAADDMRRRRQHFGQEA
ncbi:hypothetical protein DOTSEDRAFT_70666 [Dothistroma septosporum NZE10]|uniref:Uncharacterized protein n=1 Tax=Dothistroma septosporum (strain NZE10 / CBS 128990) TaxID=675120 RepID=N1PWZ6_DOTSN|nr:hypothetical protein DOTSEDRAFT_70666 [Dothistroma septosporum NZE10]